MTKTILVVDDCDTLRWGMRIVLTRAGYEVIEACDGKDALSKLDAWKIDLVVSDLNMPKMDGISLVNAMKRLLAHEAIPVIILSSDIREKKMQEGLSAGAMAWMSKPLQPAQMLASILQLVNPGSLQDSFSDLCPSPNKQM